MSPTTPSPIVNPTDSLYWERLDQLVQTSQLIIDRPKGTAHPRYPDFIYPLDYGYIEGTLAADGGGVDVWLGSIQPPSGKYRVTSIICTIDLTKRDAELKILINCTPDEANLILITHNEGPQSGILILRPESG